MKVLAINGSPHAFGNTYQVLAAMAEELKGQGIDCEIVHVGSGIPGCSGCGVCRKTGKCVHDDIVNRCAEKMEQADGLIVGTPVHYSGIAGDLKSFLDRFFYMGAPLAHKVAAGAAILRRSGGVDTFHQLNNFFNLANCIITPSQYWTVVHGAAPGEVLQDLEGMDVARECARNMAWIIKMIDATRETVPAPQPFVRTRTNFIR